MKALVGAFTQEKALVGAFSVIVQPVVEPMEHYTALVQGHHINIGRRWYWYCPEVVLGLSPVLLNAQVVDERGAARVDHKVEEVDDLVPVRQVSDVWQWREQLVKMLLHI